MYKIYLAIGNEGLEQFLKSNKTKQLIESFKKTPVAFVGEAVYREGILSGVEYHQPDVVVIREGLNGKQSLTEIIYNIKMNFTDTRIIFLSGDREIGDALLATLVQYGVYDLIIGSKIDCTEIIRKIIEPNKLSDVAYLLPKIAVDEKTNRTIFKAPDNIGANTTTNKQEISIRPIKSIGVKRTAEEESSNGSKASDMKKPIYIYGVDTNNPSLPKSEDKPAVVEKLVLNVKKEDDLVEEKENSLQKHLFDNENKSPKDFNIKETVKEDIFLVEDEEKIDFNIVSDSLLKVSPKKDKTIEDTPSNKKIFQNIFSRTKKDNGRVGQRILTFIGGKSGVGNSQISFNVALHLAQKGYRVMYMDLNDKFSSMDYIFQLGYSDVGIDTALNSIETQDYILLNKSISNRNKILPETDEDNYLYKTYVKFPQLLDFLFFSQEYMNKDNLAQSKENIKLANPDNLKELHMYLLMNEGYDFIILDAPSDIHNKFTELALIYSTKIFFTITQDVSILGNHLNQLKIMNKKGINFKEKFYYLLNKNENASMSLKYTYDWLSDMLKLEGFNIVPIPNLNKDIINSNYQGVPILWNTKSKEFHKAFSEIEKLILQ